MFIELNEFCNFSDNKLNAGTETNINRYDVELREIEHKLFGVEMEDHEQQENYVRREIKET